MLATLTSTDATVGTNDLPLVVDLDGTLTPTDTLAESVVRLTKEHPWNSLAVPFWLLQGRAVLKARVAERTQLPVATLPLRQDLVDYLRNEKARGRKLMLATAAHRSIAEPFADRLDVFDTVLASDENTNLKGRTKLAAIQQHYPQGFVYAGDSKADLPIWSHANRAILVGTSRKVTDEVRGKTVIEREFVSEGPKWKVWMRALRVHQWAKNLLLFVPLLTGFGFFEPERLLAVLLAFIAFSLAASATYLVNDLWDIDSDRVHLRKRHRPFASGKIGIGQGVGVAGLLLCTSLAVASAVSLQFAGMLVLYLVMTSAYSWTLKRYVLVDVVMLSVLYTLRILAGSVAAHMATTSWLLAFSIFVFISLALVKRCSELVSLQQCGKQEAHGRDYQVSDLAVLWPLGCAASMASIVVFGLYISVPETRMLYARDELLWIAALGLVYWQARLWIKTSRGEMHDDPLVFAIRDAGSRVTVMAILALILVSRFVKF